MALHANSASHTTEGCYRLIFVVFVVLAFALMVVPVASLVAGFHLQELSPREAAAEVKR